MRAEEGMGLHEAIVRHVSDMITVVDPDGVVSFINQAGIDEAAAMHETALDSDALSWVHPDDQDLTLERRQYLLGAPGRKTTTVLRVRQASGWRHVETHGLNLIDDPQVRGLLYITRDVEDRARAEAMLMHALAAQSVVAELGLGALRSQDVDSVLREGLERVRSMLGAQWVTLLLLDGRGRLRVRRQAGPAVLPPRQPEIAAADSQAGLTLRLRHAVLSEDLQLEERFRRSPEQEALSVRAEVDVLVEGVEGPLGLLTAASSTPRSFRPAGVNFLQGVANVLAGALEREKRERSAVVQALQDPLTGLPTRPLFTDRLTHALSRARRADGAVALLLVDLDRFKEVNDVWGHAAGDVVLRTLGPRLAACTRASDTAARYGGDEFVVLCEEDVTHVGVARVAAAIRAVCSQPVELPSGESVAVSASIGIAWSVEEGLTSEAMLAAADAAMYRDKRRGQSD